MSSRPPPSLLPEGPRASTAHDAAREASILHRLGRRETAALTELWDAWSRPLFAIAVRALGSVEDAEEVLQDALVRFWEKAPSYDPAQSAPFTWGIMILRGLLFDRLRARQRRPLMMSGQPDSQDILQHLATAALDPLSCGGQHDLASAFATLSPQEREVIQSAVFEPATHEAIALRLNQPLGTIKTRIRLALAKFRAALVDASSP